VDESDTEIARVIELIRRLHPRAARVDLHVDLDSHDTEEAQANKYAAPGVPSLTRLLDCIRQVAERHTVAAAAITASDPASDPDDGAITASRAIARKVARSDRSQPTSGTG